MKIMNHYTFLNPQPLQLVHNNILPYAVSGDMKRLEVTILAIEELFSFMRPLSLELTVECQDENWSTSSNTTPQISHWHLQNESEFPYVKIEPNYPVESVIKQENIMPDTIFDWVKTALEQSFCPSPYNLTWTHIGSDAFLARLPNSAEFDNCDYLKVDAHTFPIEHLDDSIWVAGPHQQQVGAFAPLFFEFHNNYGALTATIFTSWSIWGHSGTPGMQVIRTAVSRLQEQGWELDFPGFLEQL